MISATSSLASGLLSSAFGTPAPSTLSIPGNSTASTSSTASIISNLLPSDADSAFLSNLTFGEDTAALLRNPLANGALTGTPSSYVQQIIQKLAPGAPASATTNSTQNSTTAATPAATGDNSTTTPSTSILPPDGILA